MAAEMAAPPVPYPMLIPCRTEQVNDQAAEFGARSFPALPHLSACKDNAFLCALGTVDGGRHCRPCRRGLLCPAQPCPGQVCP